MVTEYTKEFKESMLQKIFSNAERSVVSFAKDANVPASTVATWVKNYKKKSGNVMGAKKQRPERWTRGIRNWNFIEKVSLNPDKSKVIDRKEAA